jgi:carbon storage regulator
MTTNHRGKRVNFPRFAAIATKTVLAVTLFEQGQGVIAMLVLSRKTGERIHIGDNITIEVRRVAGNRVTIALDAPRDVRILRGELEQAAREFEEPGPKQEEPAAQAYVLTHARLGSSDGLATHELGTANFAI